MESIVRLSTLKLSNIKNVIEGQILMPHVYHKKNTYTESEILGIYGQNGSGKTALIDTLYYLQQIMNGHPLPDEFADYIDINSEQAEIKIDFLIYKESYVYEVCYSVKIKKNEKGVEIIQETLSSSIDNGEEKTNKTIFMNFQRNVKEPIFTPKKRLDEVIEKDKNIKTDLVVARKLAEKSNCSYIFGESSREIFCKEYDNGFSHYAVIIESLFRFALVDLFVIRNTHSGFISANFILPMAFKIEQDKVGVKGDFAIPLKEPVVLNKLQKNLLYSIVDQMNDVLYTIIPGMKIDIADYGKQMMDDGEEGFKLELKSARDGFPPIPIRMESEGIIKIISILNALIQAFGNPSICLAIDELDSGIFEYMLGELLDIFSKSGKGQLVFTSHNLRALEMLKNENIMFSTTNPKHRYVHMKNIKSSNNIRDVYMRVITLGGQDEIIYEETDSLKIARAFRKAGRCVKNE